MGFGGSVQAVPGVRPGHFPVSSHECEHPQCSRLATWWVRGQWTIFDWLDVEVCGEHLVAAHRYLELRTVDGLKCQERVSHYIGECG